MLAASLLGKCFGLSQRQIEDSLTDFSPAFGRQEKIKVGDKFVQIFLSKNPTSMNESLRTVNELGGKYILFVLNDRIPDGRDVSWIWDINFEQLLTSDQKVFASGDRVWDMALRLQYAHPVIKTVDMFPLLEKGAINSSLERVPKGETLYILPTYSAMLEVRHLLTGRKIL